MENFSCKRNILFPKKIQLVLMTTPQLKTEPQFVSLFIIQITAVTM